MLSRPCPDLSRLRAAVDLLLDVVTELQAVGATSMEHEIDRAVLLAVKARELVSGLLSARASGASLGLSRHEARELL